MKEGITISLNNFRIYFINLCTGIIAGIFPALWYFGAWPHVLSFHLYSGYNPNLEYWFYNDNDRIWNSPYQESGLIFEDSSSGEKTIMVDIYGAEENNLPVFSEEIYFRYTGKKLCEYFNESGEHSGILIKARKKFSAGYDLKRFTCSELLED